MAAMSVIINKFILDRDKVLERSAAETTFATLPRQKSPVWNWSTAGHRQPGTERCRNPGAQDSEAGRGHPDAPPAGDVGGPQAVDAEQLQQAVSNAKSGNLESLFQ
jgi:hypothetical protein